MAPLKDRLEALQAAISQHVAESGRTLEEIVLIAVSKGRSVEEVQTLYELGLRHFGENRLFEALEKKQHLPADIHWHFIGKLQRNKVSKAMGAFTLIHSVDTVALAEKLSWASQEYQLQTAILLEVNSAGETSKSGLSPEKWLQAAPHLFSLKGILIRGLMTLAPQLQSSDPTSSARTRSAFSTLRTLQRELEETSGQCLAILSMGMSQDFHLAIYEGATHLRIGSALFEA